MVSGIPQGHTIHSAGDVDWINFTLTEVSEITITTGSGAGVDTVVFLFDTEGAARLEPGSFIASDDDGGEGALSSMSIVVGPGDYFILVNEFGNDDAIPGYFIELRATPTIPMTVDPLTTNNTTPSLTGTVGDPSANIEVFVDGIPVAGAVNLGDGTWRLEGNAFTEPISEGVHEVQVVATTEGNRGEDTTSDELTIDITPPVVSVDPQLTNSAAPRLTGTIDDPDASLTVTVNGVLYDSEVRVDEGVWVLPEGVVQPELTDGIYDVSVSALDLAGNTGADQTLNELEIDTLAPEVVVTELSTTDPRPILSGFVDDPAADVLIEVVAPGGQSVFVGAANNTGGGNWELPDDAFESDLPDGVYNIIATGVDPAGNEGVDTQNDELTIDTTAPLVTVRPSLTQNNQPVVGGTVDDPTAALQLTVNGSVYEPVNTGTGVWVLPAGTITPALEDGVYDVELVATDALGNIGRD
ncbi:MAG: DVUA0089 family protein, partial [Planctomycetota bacterium]